MKRAAVALLLIAVLALTLSAADPELAGTWIGSVATDRGTMDIGLSLVAEKGKLSGALKTAHGDWAVTQVQEKDGLWTVSFKGDANEGRLIGRIKGTAFTGEWKSAHSNGTFELSRARKK
jgi:hypothetical protein